MTESSTKVTLTWDAMSLEVGVNVGDKPSTKPMYMVSGDFNKVAGFGNNW